MSASDASDKGCRRPHYEDDYVIASSSSDTPNYQNGAAESLVFLCARIMFLILLPYWTPHWPALLPTASSGYIRMTPLMAHAARVQCEAMTL